MKKNDKAFFSSSLVKTSGSRNAWSSYVGEFDVDTSCLFPLSPLATKKRCKSSWRWMAARQQRLYRCGGYARLEGIFRNAGVGAGDDVPQRSAQQRPDPGSGEGRCEANVCWRGRRGVRRGWYCVCLGLDLFSVVVLICCCCCCWCCDLWCCDGCVIAACGVAAQVIVAANYAIATPCMIAAHCIITASCIVTMCQLYRYYVFYCCY